MEKCETELARHPGLALGNNVRSANWYILANERSSRGKVTHSIVPRNNFTVLVPRVHTILIIINIPYFYG